MAALSEQLGKMPMTLKLHAEFVEELKAALHADRERVAALEARVAELEAERRKGLFGLGASKRREGADAGR